MLGTLPTPILLDIAIFFTALCWSLGFFIADRKIYLFASLAIGCFVCLFGYSVESLGAPPWPWSQRRCRWIFCFFGTSLGSHEEWRSRMSPPGRFTSRSTSC